MDRGQFLVRYYEWAEQEWQREIEAGLPRLTVLPCRSLRAAALTLRRRGEDEQRRIAGVLLKRFHPEARQVLAQPWTPEDEALFERFHRERFDAITQADVSARPAPKIDTKTFRKQLREALTALTGSGPDPEYEIGVEWRHVQCVAGLRLVTYADTGGRTRQAECQQDVYAADGSEIRRFISLGAWLGLGQTRFDCIEPGDESKAAAEIVDLCRYFTEALPCLVR